MSEELMTTKLPTDDQTGKIVGDLLSQMRHQRDV